MSDSKVCKDCNTSQPLENFQQYWNNKLQKHRRMAICKACRPARRNKEREKAAAKKRRMMLDNPEYRRNQLNASHRWRYGITLDEKVEMLAAQGGVCAVCGTNESGKRDWCVDHDHACCPQSARSCGKCIRGIICARCNFALGQMDDDVAKLQAAIDYLNRTRTQSDDLQRLP